MDDRPCEAKVAREGGVKAIVSDQFFSFALLALYWLRDGRLIYNDRICGLPCCERHGVALREPAASYYI